ncbi:MAG: glycosyltransferase family 2 protein [Planctomycetota bacterium]|nr:glycosyltransferase family 2 protein [Planctomycetota bacterium]
MDRAARTPPPAPRPDVPVRSLAIVLPCRNEADAVADVVDGALRWGGASAPVLEVVLVDDASTDRTGGIADDLARRDARVRVVHNARSRGYGGALRAGFAATTADWVFYTDGDGQFDLAELPGFLAHLVDADVVIGRRARRAEGPVRRLNAWGWTLAVNAAFGLRVRDVDCAFKVFPGAFLRALPLVSDGALISAELLARSRRAGLRVVQRDVSHHPRRAGRATGANLRVIARAFRELVSLRATIRGGASGRGASVPPEPERPTPPGANDPPRSRSTPPE